ncbi:hypothetical protein Scep_006383 [Stephania cephalantha]|uniref:Superoxide dismutase copper chaperone n=1 Tax=Stephania cephalantha TaxID=152367 RepID=A0AAP0PNY7_9MAGN
MAILKALSVTAAALAFAAHSSSSQSPNPSLFKLSNLPFLSTSLLASSDRLGLSRTIASPRASLRMDSTTSVQTISVKENRVLPELMTEFMVDMKCEGCVKAVRNKLLTVDGVKEVEVDLSNQVVRIRGSSPVKRMADALEETGRKARLIGQGNPEEFLISAAVAEFKGPDIFGVVRLAQVNMELARIEASFSGLPPKRIGWSINEFGDLTRGAASTGKVFNPINQVDNERLGDLGTLDVKEDGEAFFSGVKEKLRVADLIGRSIALYATEDKSDSGITAAVIARSAGVGQNYKQLCTCDGTIIWESSSNDFVVSKV